MSRRSHRTLFAFVICGLFFAAAPFVSAADSVPSIKVGAAFESLQVGPTTYRHVLIRSIGPRSVMISHEGGLVSVPLRALSAELQAAFGYNPAAESSPEAAPVAPKRAVETPGKPARKPAMLAGYGFDALLQSFGTPPEIRPAADLRPRFSALGLNVKNQGPRPSCAVFAIVSALELQNGQITGQPERFSEEYLVWATYKTLNRTPRARPAADAADVTENLDNADEGFALAEVVTALRTYGVPPQSSLPYSYASASAAVDPPSAVIAEARSHRRVFVNALPGRDQPTRIANLIHALNAGVPIAVGLRWPSSRTLRSGYLNTQKPLEGNGHAVTIVGYENKTGAIRDTVFVFKNSWGVKWGASGYGYATYAYLHDNLVDSALLEVEPVATAQPPRG